MTRLLLALLFLATPAAAQAPVPAADLQAFAAAPDSAITVGTEVTIALAVANLGPDAARNAVVALPLPDSLALVRFEGPGRLDEFQEWVVGDVAVGDTLRAALTVRAEGRQAFEVCAFIKGFDGEDDKPENDVQCVSLAPRPSSGGDGGVESNGDAALLLTNRFFERWRARASAAAARVSVTPSPFRTGDAAALAGRRASALADVVPQAGPAGSAAVVATPADLIGPTNAVAVIAVDYETAGRDRVAALFGAATVAGDLYEHTKVTCDRLVGAVLADVEVVQIAGHPFVQSTLVHPDGWVDYAVSFVAYRAGGAYTVDSRFGSADYRAPAAGDEVLNLQVWSGAPGRTAALVATTLELMGARAPVTFANTADAAPAVPALWVRAGGYARGALELEVENTAGLTSVEFQGTVATAEGSERTPFRRTVALSGARREVVRLETGFVFDAALTAAAAGYDDFYLADAAWGHAFDPAGATVTRFETFEQTAGLPEAGFAYERGAAFAGTVETWASLFRFLERRGAPVDLSSVGYVEFEARGAGTFEVQLVKGGVDAWDQYGATFTAADTARTVRLPFSAFTRVNGVRDFRADDVTTVAFYPAAASGGEAFTLEVSGLRFAGDPASVPPAEPAAPGAVAAYPNPAAGAVRFAFAMEAPGAARLAVYDVLGRRVAVLLDGVLEAGDQAPELDARALPTGAYFFRLETAGGARTGRFTVAR